MEEQLGYDLVELTGIIRVTYRENSDFDVILTDFIRVRLVQISLTIRFSSLRFHIR